MASYLVVEKTVKNLNLIVDKKVKDTFCQIKMDKEAQTYSLSSVEHIPPSAFS